MSDLNNSLFIQKSGKRLRCGYTTGSCAAAASKAALMMLLTGEDIHNVSILTPKGALYHAEILDIARCGESVSCAVRKDGGDDPDITDGVLIYAKVRLLPEAEIVIKGGEGVGVVTKPGLDQPVGEAAINAVPRKMIAENLREVLEKYRAGACGAEHDSGAQRADKNAAGAEVVISVPAGKALAEKTFNPRLGIVGGISILGTTGIVEPMSESAIVETIRAEISVRYAEGRSVLAAAPGNYGLSFLAEKYRVDESLVVMSSNFVYDTVRIAAQTGFRRMLFAGHIGKLVKVAGGIRNTHSMYGDHRMEILADICSAFLEGERYEELERRLMDCAVTDEAVRIICEEGLGDLVFPEMVRRIQKHMEDFGERNIRVEVIVFYRQQTGAFVELAATEGAAEFMDGLQETAR